MAEGPGKIGEAPPQSPPVMDMAVRFLETLTRSPAESRPLVPPTPLSPCDLLPSNCLSLNPNEL